LKKKQRLFKQKKVALTEQTHQGWSTKVCWRSGRWSATLLRHLFIALASSVAFIQCSRASGGRKEVRDQKVDRGYKAIYQTFGECFWATVAVSNH